jgi:hypothetical protein
MNPLFVLVHSPSVGPATWRPVADELRARGHDTLVPSLLRVGSGGPPYWPRVVEEVRSALANPPPDRPVVLVVHSNAGLFLPVIRAALSRPVAASVFVDAALPSVNGPTPVVDRDQFEALRGLADETGRLPRWTDWYDEAVVAALLPDPAVRRIVVGEQPRLPLDYYAQTIPVPAGWADHPCGYLLFGPPYDGLASTAADRGWAVRTVPGQHLHQVVDPPAVAAAIEGLAFGPR